MNLDLPHPGCPATVSCCCYWTI